MGFFSSWTSRGDSESLETMGFWMFLDVFGFVLQSWRRKMWQLLLELRIPVFQLPRCNILEARSLERLERQRHALEAEVEVNHVCHIFWCMLRRFCADSEEFRHDNTKTRAGDSGNPNPSAFLRLRDRFESYPGGLGLHAGGLGRIIFEVIIELDQERDKRLHTKNCIKKLQSMIVTGGFVTTQMVDSRWISFHKNPPWHRSIPQGFATEPLTSAGREGMGVPSWSLVKHERVIRDYRKWKFYGNSNFGNGKVHKI